MDDNIQVEVILRFSTSGS